MTIEDGSKSLKHRMTLLALSQKVGANTTEASSPLLGSESARNLLLDFGHTQVSLGLIVSKWPRKVIHESEDLLSTRKVGIEQILGRSLFGWPPPFGHRSKGWWRLSGIESRPEDQSTGLPTSPVEVWEQMWLPGFAKSERLCSWSQALPPFLQPTVVQLARQYQHSRVGDGSHRHG
jgi:hypothetical protein